LRAFVFSSALLILRLPLAAAPLSPDAGQSSLFTLHNFRDVAISPDGGKVAWIDSAPNKIEGELPSRSIYVKDLRDAGAGAKRVGDPSSMAQGLAWSEDGRLAFLSDADSHGQMQLYVAEKPGRGKPRKIGEFRGYVELPRWSPDGKSIAVLEIEGSSRVPGPTEATATATGVIGSEAVEKRLAIVNLATGAARTISPADMYVYEFDWAPSGKELAYLAAPGEGDDNWYVAELYAIDAESGAVRHIFKPALQAANVRWSPDGKTIAFIGGLMSDEGVTGGDIYALPAEGGAAPRDLTPNRKASPNWFRWSPSSKQIIMTENISGSSAISTLDVASGSVETLWKGAESVSFSGDAATSAVVRSSFDQAPEVWAGPTGKWQQLTHSNDGQQRAWGEGKSLEWKSGGWDVQGWLMLPQPYDPAKRYPMVVVVHGGPASGVRPSWPNIGSLSPLSGQGYFVFEPNPRGSYGQGEAFTRANAKDFGHGDLDDILAGVDAVVKNYPVDNERVGIAGWSYGGYMTMWAVTQTNRFRAAFAGAGIANWQSYYGENGIDQWMIPYFGASVYDDPAVYAKSSPINFIKNVKTPTLVMVGDRDAECPPPQSYEFWHALKTFGVKTEFVLYPGEGHGFHDPEHIRDRFERVVKWFNENMPASGN
jgi:dipeptidyl aminopeptidase/acylaminoacyl peptidase